MSLCRGCSDGPSTAPVPTCEVVFGLFFTSEGKNGTTTPANPHLLRLDGTGRSSNKRASFDSRAPDVTESHGLEGLTLARGHDKWDGMTVGIFGTVWLGALTVASSPPPPVLAHQF